MDTLPKLDRLTMRMVAFAERTRRMPGWLAYLIVTVVIVAIEVGRILLLHGVPAELPKNQYLPFYFTVVFSSLFLDRYTGIWATVLSLLVASVTKGPIPNSVTLKIELTSAIPYLITGLMLAMLIETLNHLFERHKEVARRSEVLIRDLNHRVKNHLASVAGLVTLSKKKLTDPMAKEVLDTVASRLTVLARLYDRLHLDNDNAAVRIQLPDFINAVCADLESGVVGEREIIIVNSVAPVEITADKAVPIGLLVNELVTNSLKHAFPGDEGTITVSFEKNSGDYLLKVCDDGIGGHTEKSGTGVRLINMLSRQLSGTVSVIADGGGRCSSVALPLSLLN